MRSSSPLGLGGTGRPDVLRFRVGGRGTFVRSFLAMAFYRFRVAFRPNSLSSARSCQKRSSNVSRHASEHTRLKTRPCRWDTRAWLCAGISLRHSLHTLRFPERINTKLDDEPISAMRSSSLPLGLLSREVLPPLDRHVDIGRLEPRSPDPPQLPDRETGLQPMVPQDRRDSFSAFSTCSGRLRLWPPVRQTGQSR